MGKCVKFGKAGQVTDDNMAHAHCMWITKANSKPSGYVMLIAFPLQQLLQERISMLRYA
jgi:hypothetical protein